MEKLNFQPSVFSVSSGNPYFIGTKYPKSFSLCGHCLIPMRKTADKSY